MNPPADETLAGDSFCAPPLAVIRDYNSLHEALRARANSLQVTRLGMDEVAGLPNGYCGKLLSPEVRTIGRCSLGPLLTTLGCMLVLTEDAEALSRFAARVEKRRAHANGGMLTKRTPHFTGFRGDSSWGKSMRNLGLLSIGPRRRKRIARNAAKARWAKHRANTGRPRTGPTPKGYAE